MKFVKDAERKQNNKMEILETMVRVAPKNYWTLEL